MTSHQRSASQGCGQFFRGGEEVEDAALFEGSSVKSIDSDWAGSWLVAGLPFVGTGGPDAGSYVTGVHFDDITYTASGVLALDAILDLLGGNMPDPGLLEQIRELVLGGAEITFSADGAGPHTIYATTQYYDVCPE